MKKEELLKKMTLDEKIHMIMGRDFWNTYGISRLEIPSIILSDGPHGLCRRISDQGLKGINAPYIISTPFPTSTAAASTFNRELLMLEGQAIAREANSVDVSLLLGPGVNLKRNPLCGRNFEYYSEDPYLTIECAKSFINGVQKEGIGACVKHFMCNNTEYGRMIVDTTVTERALYEVYGKVYKEIIEQSHPWGVMCSYNRVNGSYMSQSPYIKEILRDYAHFDGVTISDWGAMDDRVEAILNGLDIEMPFQRYRVEEVYEGLKQGRICEQDIDQCVLRILDFVEKSNKKISFTNEIKDQVNESILKKSLDFSKKISDEAMVLLKNDSNILPILEKEEVLVIGEVAESFRYQGGGSSCTNPYELSCFLEYLTLSRTMTYYKGYHGSSTKIDHVLEQEAMKGILDRIQHNPNLKILFFTGYTEFDESEGYDRTSLSLPKNQLSLLNKIAQISQNIIVCNITGGSVELPFIRKIKGLIQVHYSGCMAGKSLCDIITGEVNPSGHLSESFLKSIKDSPSQHDYDVFPRALTYYEDVFIGYKYYQKENIKVNFPFGYGLSYTEFSYSNFTTTLLSDSIHCEFVVKNIGNYKGKCVPQIYYSFHSKLIPTPKNTLIEFIKIELNPQEERKISLDIPLDRISQYDSIHHGFTREVGSYQISLSSDANTPIFVNKIRIDKKHSSYPYWKIDMNTTLNELLLNPNTKPITIKFMKKYQMSKPSERIITPLRNILTYSEEISKNEILDFILQANEIQK